jgi:phospholipid N-methyltransferase
MKAMTDDELKHLFDALQRDNVALRQDLATARAEMRRHFDVTVERLETKFDTLVEGVTSINGNLSRRIDVVEESIERTAADTQAMIKFSHSELRPSRAHARTRRL